MFHQVKCLAEVFQDQLGSMIVCVIKQIGQTYCMADSLKHRCSQQISVCAATIGSDENLNVDSYSSVLYLVSPV